MTKHKYLDVHLIVHYARKGVNAVSMGDEASSDDAVFHLDQLRKFILENKTQKCLIFKPELVEGLLLSLENFRLRIFEYQYDGRDTMRGAVGLALKKLLAAIREYQNLLSENSMAFMFAAQTCECREQEKTDITDSLLTNPATVQALVVAHPYVKTVYNHIAPTANDIMKKFSPYFTPIVDRARARLENIVVVGPSVLQAWEQVGMALDCVEKYCSTNDVHAMLRAAVTTDVSADSVNSAL